MIKDISIVSWIFRFLLQGCVKYPKTGTKCLCSFYIRSPREEVALAETRLQEPIANHNAFMKPDKGMKEIWKII